MDGWSWFTDVNGTGWQLTLGGHFEDTNGIKFNYMFVLFA